MNDAHYMMCIYTHWVKGYLIRSLIGGKILEFPIESLCLLQSGSIIHLEV